MSNKKGVLITTKNFKPLTDADIIKLADDVFDDYIQNEDLFEDLKNILNPDVLKYSSSDRKTPAFVPGYLDKPFLQGGMPVRKKDRDVVNAVLSGNYTFVELEGGVRGGKDVIGLFSWSKYLMTCKEKTHLALGISLENALRNILIAHGFGLWNNIPHGIFIRESVSGAQRGIYKFLDIYGLEKEVLFYGNAKENDGDKYQGFTLGSVYVNETLNQHLNGLDQALSRIATSSHPLMIMTQNPSGEMSKFYQMWEKPKLTSEENVRRLELYRELYKEPFEIIENRLKFGHEDPIERERLLNERGIRWRNLERKEIKRLFLQEKGKTRYEFLDTAEQLELNKQLLDVNYRYDAKIRDIPVEFFDPHLPKTDYLYGKSMKKVVGFNRGEENVNKIVNAYNFFYSHYTADDNMSMNEMARRDFRNSYAEGTAYHDQKVKGLRRAAEGAVYSSFGPENIFDMDLMDFDWEGKERIITIDPGYNDATGITEKAYDAEKGILYYLTERKIDFNIEYVDRKTEDTVYEELLKMIRAPHANRQVDVLIVDPSKPEFIDYLRVRGWHVYPANNKNWTAKKEEKTYAEQITSRELRGIPLAITAVAKRKIMVHVNCVNLIQQIQSYTFDMIEDKNARGDDLVVHLKYDINTLNITSAMWIMEDDKDDLIERGVIDDEQRVYGDGDQKDFEREMARQIAEAFSPFREFDTQETEWENEQSDFFGGTDFFN